MLSPYEKHKTQWLGCTRCALCEKRKLVVLGRGSLPCDVLLTGEGPGPSEDVLGRPFVGPAGKLLDSIIQKALPAEVTFAMTNLVGCIPLDENQKKWGEPPDYAIEACAPRVRAFVDMAKPKLIVAVGDLAEFWLPSILTGKQSTIPRGKIIHPAAIVRMNIAQQGLAYQRAIVALSDAWEDL